MNSDVPDPSNFCLEVVLFGTGNVLSNGAEDLVIRIRAADGKRSRSTIEKLPNDS